MEPAKKTRTSRSKAEVQEEFQDLIEQSQSAKENASSKSESVLFMRETEGRQPRC